MTRRPAGAEARARTDVRPAGRPVAVVDELDGDGFAEHPEQPEPISGDRLALRLLLQSLPVGTLLERNGIGFAPLFRPSADDGRLATASSGWSAW